MDIKRKSERVGDDARTGGREGSCQGLVKSSQIKANESNLCRYIDQSDP